MDLPRIRQTLFIVDKHRTYKFDVNQTITIKNLKKMIVAAANLGKSGLRIFHKGQEYTDYEDSTLNDLFPDLQLVEFTMTIVYTQEEDKETNIKVRMGSYCIRHQYKYPYFYCYDCSRSICSLCLTSGDHSGHNTIEKYDYFQSSRNLVESIFNDMNELLSGAKFNYKNEIEDLRHRVKVTFFPNLVELVTKIEMKFYELIDNYFAKAEVSFSNMTQNVVLVKNHCSDGLDKLKTEIAIEDMMLDEEIFLTFDRKFKDISSEKGRVLAEAKKFDEMHMNFQLVVTIVEKYYNEIYDFLEKYLNSNIFNEITNKIQENVIGTVNKEEIFKRLLSDIKKKGRKFTSNVKNPGGTPQSGIMKAIYGYSSSQFEEKEFVSHTPKSGITSRSNLSNINLNPNLTSNNISSQLNNQLLSVAPPQSQAFTSGQAPSHSPNSAIKTVEKVSYSEKIVYSRDAITLMTVVPNSKEVIIYNDTTSMINRRTVEFPILLGINNFLANCAWINVGGKLYICGGTQGGAPSNNFLCFDVFTATLTRLSDMLNARHYHSLFYQGDFIYAIGGEENSCEKYDLKNSKWIKLNNLVLDQCQNPVLFVHNNYLYSFFGVKGGNYIDSVERLNIKNQRSKWEIVPFKNPNKLDLKMTGCGIIEISDSEIYMFGGKTRDTVKRDAISFDFSSLTFSPVDIKLDDGTYFMESRLIDFGNNSYGQFNLYKEDILKLQIS